MGLIGTHVNTDRPGDGQYTVDSYTKLLIHSGYDDGSTGGANFVDSSDDARAVTHHADVIHDTAQRISSLGGSSMYFDGSNDSYLSIPSHSDFAAGTGPYTLDCWAKNNGSSQFSGLIDHRPGSGYNGLGQFAQTPSGYFRVHNTFDNCGGTSASPIDSGWHHLAYVRNGGDSKIWVDGIVTETSSAYETSDDIASSVPIMIGVTNSGIQGETGAENYTGWITEVRISIGIARWWSSNFPVYGIGTDGGQ